MPMDVRRLRMLHELSQRGTLGAVADALHQSPSSVSQGLALLEKEVGVTLLRRAGRRLELTEAGQLLARRGAEVLSLLEASAAEVAGLEGTVAGTVRIGAFQSAALAIVPGMLTTMAREHPRVRLTMTQRGPEGALAELAARDLDLTIAESYPDETLDLAPGLHAQELGTDHLRVVLPPGGRWRKARTLADCRDLPWVLEPEGTATHAFALRTCHAAGFAPDVRYLVDDLETQLRLIESGHAVTIMPSLMLTPRPRQVRVVDLPGPSRRRLYSVARTSTAGTAAILACREALAAAYREATGEEGEPGR